MFRSLKIRSALAGAALAAAALLVSVPVNAAQVFLQNGGAAPAGGDPNIITNAAAFEVGLPGVGSGPTQNPLLIVVADYNGAGPAPTITSSLCGGLCSLATIGTYGLTSNTVLGFNSGTAFAAVGLANAGGSVSFGNMSAAEVADLGLAAPTSFDLYVFALPVSLLGATPITIGTTAGYGDYIFAYACDQQGGTGACPNAGSTNANVFTNAGLIADRGRDEPAPEPATLVLLGSALAGIGLLRRRKLG